MGADNLSYDGNGNLSGWRGDGFTYDEDNRLATFSKTGASAQYSYDGLNRRVKRAVIGSPADTAYFIYDGDQVIEERDAAGALVAEYANGPSPDELLAIYRGTDKYYVLTDGLGSVTDLVGAAGNVVERFTYDVYGQPDHVSAITPYLFTGQRYDAESGLYYYKARMYSPTLGRFLQRDPIGYYDSMNLYQYVLNNPVNYTDPYGLQCASEDIAVGATIAVLALAGTAILIDYYNKKLSPYVADLIANILQSHRKPRPSTKDRHEYGEGRKKKDQRRGEAGDINRPLPRKRPPGWTGPYPSPGQKTW